MQNAIQPNVAAIRFIASCIQHYPENYDQGTWGSSEFNAKFAGVGPSCRTPCCIAGFAVQYLGNPEEYIAEGELVIDKDRSLYRVSTYASMLLGLTRGWSLLLFHSRWPRIWLAKDMPLPVNLSDDEGVTMTARMKLGEMLSFRPTTEEAVFVLNRLADHFENIYGANAETENRISHVKKELLVTA